MKSFKAIRQLGLKYEAIVAPSVLLASVLIVFGIGTPARSNSARIERFLDQHRTQLTEIIQATPPGLKRRAQVSSANIDFLTSFVPFNKITLEQDQEVYIFGLRTLASWETERRNFATFRKSNPNAVLLHHAAGQATILNQEGTTIGYIDSKILYKIQAKKDSAIATMPLKLPHVNLSDIVIRPVAKVHKENGIISIIPDRDNSPFLAVIFRTKLKSIAHILVYDPTPTPGNTLVAPGRTVPAPVAGTPLEQNSPTPDPLNGQICSPIVLGSGEIALDNFSAKGGATAQQRCYSECQLSTSSLVSCTPGCKATSVSITGSEKTQINYVAGACEILAECLLGNSLKEEIVLDKIYLKPLRKLIRSSTCSAEEKAEVEKAAATVCQDTSMFPKALLEEAYRTRGRFCPKKSQVSLKTRPARLLDSDCSWTQTICACQSTVSCSN